MWRRLARRLLRDESGQGSHEYVGVLVLVAVVLAGLFALTMSGAIKQMWHASACAIDSQATCSGSVPDPSRPPDPRQP